eukprot:5176846-Amphidinium_carterae.2
MDTQSDSDLLEQHNASKPVVELPGATALGALPPMASADPGTSGLADNVPGQPAEPPRQETPAPLPAPGIPVQVPAVG